MMCLAQNLLPHQIHKAVINMPEVQIFQKCIAAVRTNDDFLTSLASDAGIIFDLSPDIFSLSKKVKACHESNKKLFIHLDLATGIGKDKSGILFAKKAGVDGIISTRVSIIKLARELRLFTVQRFFIVDSQSLETTIESVKSSKPDMIEIMPGVVPKVVRRIKSEIAIPVIAGGIIETESEVESMLVSGASAVSTGCKKLWNMK
ncbi:MAG: glycerol-3-phosphate responsive antiterminator [Ruminococcaceae bacterium]|nr:glycerol-3-phosphate responsive antiterminator [Oscillospiraceae bacterium]